MFRHRISVFGKPRTPWRETADAALRDAIRLGLASWDGEAREHYLAVPVDMEVDRDGPVPFVVPPVLR